MADTLQEFLVELGFTTKNRQEFERTIQNTERKVLDFGSRVGKIGAAIAGVGIAAAKGTLAYARSLEQLNFVAQRTGTTLTRLRALQLAGASYGSSAGGAQASIEGVASFLRRNPGGSNMLLQSLGVKTTNANGSPVDTVHLMEGLADRFRQMKASGPTGEAIALRYADMLGISENMALAMMNPGFNGKVSQYSRAEGTQANKAGASAHDLMNQDRLLDAHQFGLAAEGMTPAMNTLTATLKATNEELAKLQGTDSLLNDAIRAVAGLSAAGVTPGRVAAAAGGYWVAKKLLGKGAATAAGDAAAGESAAAAGAGSVLSRLAPLARGGVGLGLLLYPHSTDSGERRALKERMARQLFPELERSDHLPRGLLDAVWAQESGRGRHLVSPAGALGDFQFMPGTAKQYGLSNPMDFQASARASARMYSDLFHRYGSTQKALAAYNWGSGNLDRDLAQHGENWLRYAPPETQKYVRQIQARMNGVMAANRFSAGKVQPASVSQTINTTIHVSGTSNPDQTARQVAQAQKQVNQQLARDTAGAFR